MADLDAGRAFNGLHPYNFPELFSHLILGQMRAPGIVELSGHDRNENWDIQKASGTEGATSKLNGSDLAEFDATFTLSADSDDEYGHNDFTRWEEFQELIDSTTNGPEPVALPIYHPDLARQRIRYVVKRSVGGMRRLDDGTGIVVVKFGEHRPSKPKAAAKPVAKDANGNGYGVRQREDPNEAAKKELASLLEKAQAP